MASNIVPRYMRQMIDPSTGAISRARAAELGSQVTSYSEMAPKDARAGLLATQK